MINTQGFDVGQMPYYRPIDTSAAGLGAFDAGQGVLQSMQAGQALQNLKEQQATAALRTLATNATAGKIASMAPAQTREGISASDLATTGNLAKMGLVPAQTILAGQQIQTQLGQQDVEQAAQPGQKAAAGAASDVAVQNAVSDAQLARQASVKKAMADMVGYQNTIDTADAKSKAALANYQDLAAHPESATKRQLDEAMETYYAAHGEYMNAQADFDEYQRGAGKNTLVYQQLGNQIDKETQDFININKIPVGESKDGKPISLAAWKANYDQQVEGLPKNKQGVPVKTTWFVNHNSVPVPPDIQKLLDLANMHDQSIRKLVDQRNSIDLTAEPTNTMGKKLQAMNSVGGPANSQLGQAATAMTGGIKTPADLLAAVRARSLTADQAKKIASDNGWQ